MARIIVPLDGSQLAERALPWAAKVAQAQALPVHLLSVYPFEAQSWEMANIDPSNSLAHVRQSLSAYLDAVPQRPALSGLAVSYEVRAGEVASEILEACAQEPTGMIVITTHGRGGFDASGRGSVADKLVRTANLPVLVVTPVSGEAKVEAVVVTLDGSPESELAVGPARELADGASAALHLLFVVDTQPGWSIDESLQSALDQSVHKLAEEALARVRQPGDVVAIVNGKTAAAIVDYARENGCDLIVMATHGRTGRQRLDLGSVADRVVRLADRPVLLVPARAT